MSQPVFCQVRGVDTKEGDTHTVAGTRSGSGEPFTQLTGTAAVTVRIRIYNDTGKVDFRNDSLTLGTRVLLTCDVTGLHEGIEALSYRWYHNCTVIDNSRCEKRDGDPYYRVVSDTLLLDVVSWDQGGRYYCTIHYLNKTQTAVQGVKETQRGITRKISVAG